MALLLTLSTACGTTRVVRLDTGQGEPIVHMARPAAAAPVELAEEELTQALAAQARHWRPSANPEQEAQALFGITPRSGWYGYTQRQGVVPLDPPPPASQWPPSDVALTQEYRRWCHSRSQPGDCLRLLLNSPVLNGDGRYALAMSFAMEEVLPEMMESFKDMADPEAIKATLLWTMTAYAAMWLAPEPVFSKGLATVLTASFICYIGVDTFWTLIQGWRRMVDIADRATSLSELSQPGRQEVRQGDGQKRGTGLRPAALGRHRPDGCRVLGQGANAARLGSSLGRGCGAGGGPPLPGGGRGSGGGHH